MKTQELDFTGKELLAALRDSVELQSHYAHLLNIYDGGHRMEFKSAEAWLERLRFLKNNKTIQ